MQMEQHYHIIKQEKMPSSQEIEAYKDFDALLATYQSNKPKVGKSTLAFPYWILLGAAMAASLAGFFFFWNTEVSSSATYFRQQSAYFQARPFIERPFEQIEPKLLDYKVDATQSVVLTSPQGTTLTFPEQAFEYEDGGLVQGEVNVFVREMHDQVDLFLSGIPLTYDSAGVTYAMESAGMMEVYAEQNGKRVRLAANKSIDVAMPTTVVLPNFYVLPTFNLYQLNLEEKKWEYQELNPISTLISTVSPTSTPEKGFNTLDEINQQEREALAQLKLSLPEPLAPTPPAKRDNKLPTLELDFLEALTPTAIALRDKYEGAVWQLTAESPAMPSDAGTVEWDDANVVALPNTEHVFELTLISKERREKLLITPILPSKAYSEAMKQYEQDKVTYEAALAKYQKLLEEKQQNLRAQLAERKSSISLDTATTQAQNQLQEIVNRFKVTEFGIWNCDRLVPVETQPLQLTFTDQLGNKYQNVTGYLVDPTQNIVQRFLVTDRTTLRVQPNIAYWLWIVNEKKQIAILRPEQFKQLQSGENEQRVTLELLEATMKNEQDVRRVFSL